MAEWQDTLTEARRLVDDTRYTARTPDGYVSEVAWSRLGSASDYIGQVLAMPLVESAPEPPPPAPTSDEDWADLLSGAVGLVGQTKWTYGTGINENGCDIFVQRGTEVRAPHDCAVTFRSVPGGPMPIGEMVLVYPDGRAVRFRHVSTRVGNSAQVHQGDVVAIVYDPSMSMLRWPAGYPTPPDGYQHLDVALATSVVRLDPTGGAGGDVDADQHIWQEAGGIPHITVISHTPGPRDGARSAMLRRAWAQWAGQAPAKEK